MPCRGLWGQNLPNNVAQQTPDLVIRSAKRHSAVLWLLPLQQGSREQHSIRGHPVCCTHSKEMSYIPTSFKRLCTRSSFLLIAQNSGIYDEVIDVPQSAKEDSQHRANAQLITQQGGEKISEFSMADVSCDVISTHRLVKKKKKIFFFFHIQHTEICKLLGFHFK